MRFYYVIISIAIILLGFTTTMEAQSKKKKKRPDPEKVEQKSTVKFAERINADIKAGNLSLAGDFFSIAFKGSGGYKLNNWLSAGLAAKAKLFFLNDRGQSNDQTITYYGFGPYVRAKFLQQFYIQAEYDINSFQIGENERISLSSPYLGGGYMQGWGDWKFGVEVLFIVNDEVRDYDGVIEYWFGGTYNF